MANSKFIKENSFAFITALSCLLFVLYYLLVVVPENEENTDQYFKTELYETGKRLNEALQDYAGAVSDKDILENIAKQLDTIKSPYNRDSIVISAINIKRVKELEDSILLQRNIIYSHKYRAKEPNKDIVDTINNTIPINKNEIQDRIKGANNFKRFIFYDDENPKSIFIRSGVNKIMLDSLLNSKKSNRSSAFSFQNYRVYQHSFPISKTNQKISCYALVDANVYYYHTRQFKQQQIIYFALIAILLFLSIPLIKPLISSQNEKIDQSDVIAVTSSIGVLAIIMSIFLLQYFLNEGRLESQKLQLQQNSDQVYNKFTDEFKFVNQIYKEYRDTLAKNDSVKKFPLKLAEKDSIVSIQNLFTMNSNGDLIKDIYFNDTHIRKNFKTRNYFESHTKQNKLALFSAVYSRNDNRMVMLYTERIDSLNRIKNARVMGVAYHPKFQDIIKLNPDFNYLICNKAGRVYFHSNPNKNLNENVFTNTRNDKNLCALFRGLLKEQCFVMDYDLKSTLVHARVLAPVTLSEPLFLLTYKSLDFEQNLSLFAILNALVITLGYCLLIFLLAMLFSIVFYKNHLPTFSKQHLYWLFPNTAKQNEFNFLTKLNYIFVGISILFFAFFPCGQALYLIAFAGILLSFISFVRVNVQKANYISTIFVCLSSLTIVQKPMKLTTSDRFKLTTSDRLKLTSVNRFKLTT